MITITLCINKTWDNQPVTASNEEKQRKLGDGFVFKWHAGLKFKPTEPFQIGPFDFYRHAQLPVKELQVPTDLRDSLNQKQLAELVCINFATGSVIIEGSSIDDLRSHSQDLTDNLGALLFEKCNITLWYLAPSGGIDKHERNSLSHLKQAVEIRLQPLHQYLDPRDGTPNITLTMEPIRYFAGGMYCQWPVKNGVEVEIPDPKYRVFPAQYYFSTPQEFEFYHKVAALREYQWQRGLMAYIRQQSHKILLVKTFRLKKPAGPQQNLTAAQKEFQSSFYAYVRMTPNKKGVKESSPVEGTLFTIDRLNQKGGDGKHLPTPKHDQWFGKVCRVNVQLLGQARADFCLIVQRPHASTFVKAYDSIQFV